MGVLWAWYWTQPLPAISLNTQTRRLRLRDFISQGLIVDFAALITAGRNDTWWETAERGGTQTVPDEGDLGIGADEAPITRFRSIGTGSHLVINDNSDISLEDHFGGVGQSEWTIRIQTVDDVVETNTISNVGNNFINFAIGPLSDRVIINNINVDHPLIVAAYKMP